MEKCFINSLKYLIHKIKLKGNKFITVIPSFTRVRNSRVYLKLKIKKISELSRKF
jgi:hypothetical protein